MILPENYENVYPCINSCGSTAKIYASPNYSTAYKIYRKKFKYNEERFKKISSFHHPNCICPTDTTSIENNPNLYVGYEMAFDDGIALPNIVNESLTNLIQATVELPNTLNEISNHKFLITDPNPNNITFSNTYKFVDTYSFLWLQNISSNTIFQRNLNKVNVSILSGLIDYSYYQNIENYLLSTNSKYLDIVLNSTKTSTDFLYNILSIIQETTKENSLKKAKIKLLSPPYKD